MPIFLLPSDSHIKHHTLPQKITRTPRQATGCVYIARFITLTNAKPFRRQLLPAALSIWKAYCTAINQMFAFRNTINQDKEYDIRLTHYSRLFLANSCCTTTRRHTDERASLARAAYEMNYTLAYNPDQPMLARTHKHTHPSLVLCALHPSSVQRCIEEKEQHIVSLHSLSSGTNPTLHATYNYAASG